MNCATVQIGTPIAFPPPDPSCFDANPTPSVKTTGDLLSILMEKPPHNYSMLRTTCGHLGKYLDLPGDQILFDLIESKKRGFRPFLESRRYQENSVCTYVNCQRTLLKAAMGYGWCPDGNPTEACKPLLELSVEERLTDITRHFSRSTESPAEVTKEAVDRWGDARLRDGLMFTTVCDARSRAVSVIPVSGQRPFQYSSSASRNSDWPTL